MLNSSFFNFLTLNLLKHRSKHSVVFFISTLIVFILSSVLFVSSSLQYTLKQTLDQQADFVVQKMRSGKSVDTPLSWVDEFAMINGVTVATARVYGQYWFEPAQKYFTIVGIDMYEKNTVKKLDDLINGLDTNKFLDKPHMIIGSGVQKSLVRYQYLEKYNFRTPNRNIETVHIYDVLGKEANILGNDTILMEMELAKSILGIDEEHSTDIVLNVPNELERDNIKVKMILKHFDLRIIQKEEIANSYENMFNYKGGIFLVLYMIVLLAFVLILYQRYSMISSSDKKEIGILRSVGWSIKDVLVLKVLENFIVAMLAFILGLIMAYAYVFFFDAPLLSEIFFGVNNIGNEVIFTPFIPFGLIFMLFSFFVVPFISAVLIPVWKIAIIDPVESMR
ncbi:MAG: FtsX-like permease family protein [Campylobacterota bacterium]|nr:FtsX-like permease family protein [Campylobacterota bacterium]